MWQNIASLALATLLGVLSSLVSWWLLFYVLSPKVAFPEGILKIMHQPTAEDAAEWKYRIKIANVRRRNIVDVELIARLTILGRLPRLPNNSTIVYIPVGGYHGRVPRLTNKQGSLFSLEVAELDRLPGLEWPEDIMAKFRSRSLTVEDLLSLGTGANLQLFVSGYDAWSGTRRMFESKPYTSSDIKRGRFGKNASVRIIPRAESHAELAEASEFVNSPSSHFPMK